MIMSMMALVPGEYGLIKNIDIKFTAHDTFIRYTQNRKIK